MRLLWTPHTHPHSSHVRAQADFILCEACGHTIHDTDYPQLIRAALDKIIDQVEPEPVSVKH